MNKDVSTSLYKYVLQNKILTNALIKSIRQRMSSVKESFLFVFIHLSLFLNLIFTYAMSLILQFYFIFITFTHKYNIA